MRTSLRTATSILYLHDGACPERNLWGSLRTFSFSTLKVRHSANPAWEFAVLPRTLIENEFQFHFQFEEECHQDDLIFRSFLQQRFL